MFPVDFLSLAFYFLVSVLDPCIVSLGNGCRLRGCTALVPLVICFRLKSAVFITLVLLLVLLLGLALEIFLLSVQVILV